MLDAAPQPDPAETPAEASCSSSGHADTPAPAPAPAVSRAERRLVMLDLAAEACVAMLAAVPKDGTKDSADVIAKVTRALRLTLAMQAKFEEGPPAARAGSASAKAGKPANAAAAEPGAEPDAEAVDPFAALKTGAKARVRELLRDVIDRETPDPEENDTLVDALDERLLCDEAYDNIEGLPLRDVVDHLCTDLQLHPKWYRWTGEGWKPNPPFYRPLCSQFSKPSRKPILNDVPVPHPLE